MRKASHFNLYYLLTEEQTYVKEVKMVDLSHVRKEYPNATPLEDVTVTINKGDVIAVIGPSGTGKSTLIRCINQLDKVTSGEVIFDGKNLVDPRQYDEKTRRKIGMVFQSYNLFSHMTVLENVAYVPIHMQKLPRKEAYDKAVYYLRQVGMADRLYNYPSQLSGGQMQRVAIARTLATEPELILLDEPTSALDPTMVGEVEAVINTLAAGGATMMIVTHSMNLARNVANRVFYMDQGGIYEDGTPEQIFEHPQKERTRAFIERIKNLTIHIDSLNHSVVESVAAIDNFTFTYRISKDLSRHMQSLFEELCIQLIMPHMGDAPDIKVTFEYIETTGETRIVIEYPGESYNPKDTADGVALSLINSYSADYSHEVSDGVNVIKLKVV